jgi:S-(hydroxymethyl)glutathione dehydrogenase/alcohol dehydrogenase
VTRLSSPQGPIPPTPAATHDGVPHGRLDVDAIYGSANPPVDFPQLVEWYMNRRLHLDELVTATYPLARVNDALDALDDGTSVRGVIVME